MEQNRTLRLDRVQLVKRIFTLHSEGWGDTRIAKLLNSECCPTPSGKGVWQPSTIRKLITGKQVLGILQTADGQEHENYFPAIITEEEWLKANVMTGSGRATKTRSQPKPLAGLLRCSCGASMRDQSRTGRIKKDGTRNRWDYFICSKASAGAGCVFIGIPQKDVQSRLTEEIPRLLHSALEWDDNTTEVEKITLMLSLATEDVSRAYDTLKQSKTVFARNRLFEVEREAERLRKLLEQIQTAGSSIGNNLIRTLLQEPRPDDNSWWRQLVRSITIDTIEKTFTILFHNGKAILFNLDPLKQDGKIVNAAKLWDLVSRPETGEPEL